MKERPTSINILYFDRWTVFIFDYNLYLVELFMSVYFMDKNISQQKEQEILFSGLSIFLDSHIFKM